MTTSIKVDELINLDSCEYIWEKGVGFAQTPSQAPQHHHNRMELLRLLLTCFSESIYLPPVNEAHASGNRWVQLFTSQENRHALPLFTSLINTVCGYQPAGILPYNHLIWTDSKERLVEMALQVRFALTFLSFNVGIVRFLLSHWMMTLLLMQIKLKYLQTISF